MTIVEGEALINDATALVAYKVAVAAVLTGTFSAWEAGAQFVYSGIGGAALGLAIGWLIAQVRERLDDPPVEITIALMSGYAAYLPAEELGLSGVTAAVAIGLYMGSQTSRLTNSTVRMQGDAVWQILVFLLNSFLFVFIGLQLPSILDDLRGENVDTAELIIYGSAATATVIVIRLVWTFVFAYLPHCFPQPARAQPGPEAARRRDHRLDGDARRRVARRRARAARRHGLGRALRRAPADPVRRLLRDPRHARAAGALAAVADPRLNVETDDGDMLEQEARARLHAAEAALERIDELEREDWTLGDSIDRLRGIYRYRRKRFAARFDDDVDDEPIEERSSAGAR